MVCLLYRVSKDCLQRLPDSHSRPHQHQLQLLLLASPCHLHSLIPPQFSLSGFGLSEAVPEVISWPRQRKIGRLHRYFLTGPNNLLRPRPCKRIQDSLGFLILRRGFWIQARYRIPKSTIPDSISKNVPESGIGIPLHKAKDRLTWLNFVACDVLTIMLPLSRTNCIAYISPTTDLRLS